ncbi:bifunctional serine/threonine-protein kinase/universal stress protein [Parvibium lacunae]|uniref:Serine/threonine protein kinase n=1 Tax=Parvibium lacunae TaxID=1888893 RepID=A0A368L534_9BURK|nr:bifunctional serine/threonine-protein kinase/universal stress protein [Parvibium lacunae]RCS58260.1 serine/threonine protein kinase [Parvibium lacunae]
MQKLQPGMMIDGFRVEEKCHRGGMATLWRVTDCRITPVAGDLIMKVPYLADPSDPTAIVSFEVEQMILPTLHGPHVPRYIAAGDFDTQPYIVMERIQGESLRQRFEQAPLDPAEVVQIGIRVAHALHALHLQHVVHLDIKPSNILFRADGTAVLVDYGLARHDHLPDLLAEEFRLPMGTGPYIAPEQVLGIRHDPRSDQFALGVLLYHLLTGQRPFGFPTRIHGLKQRLWRDPIPPRQHNPHCPPWLQEILLRCLAVNPAQRYGSAAQLALALQNPEQVTLTALAHKQHRDNWWQVNQRRWQGRWQRLFDQLEPPQAPDGQAPGASTHLSAAPIILVAVDLSQEWRELAIALRLAVNRVFSAAPHARLACVSVLKTQRLGLELGTDAEGNNRHVKRLVELKHWARECAIPAEQMTFHVLEGSDPARVILDYANNNQVDHIVLGARGNHALRRHLGSVSAQVVAEASCTVTVVKNPT